MNDLRPMVIIAIGLRMRNWQFQDTDVSSKPKKMHSSREIWRTGAPPHTRNGHGTWDYIDYWLGSRGYLLWQWIFSSNQNKTITSPIRVLESFWVCLLNPTPLYPSKDAGDYWIHVQFLSPIPDDGQKQANWNEVDIFRKVVSSPQIFAQLAWQLHIWNR